MGDNPLKYYSTIFFIETSSECWVSIDSRGNNSTKNRVYQEQKFVMAMREKRENKQKKCKLTENCTDGRETVSRGSKRSFSKDSAPDVAQSLASSLTPPPITEHAEENFPLKVRALHSPHNIEQIKENIEFMPLRWLAESLPSCSARYP